MRKSFRSLCFVRKKIKDFKKFQYFFIAIILLSISNSTDSYAKNEINLTDSSSDLIIRLDQGLIVNWTTDPEANNLNINPKTNLNIVTFGLFGLSLSKQKFNLQMEINPAVERVTGLAAGPFLRFNFDSYSILATINSNTRYSYINFGLGVNISKIKDISSKSLGVTNNFNGKFDSINAIYPEARIELGIKVPLIDTFPLLLSTNVTLGTFTVDLLPRQYRNDTGLHKLKDKFNRIGLIYGGISSGFAIEF